MSRYGGVRDSIVAQGSFGKTLLTLVQPFESAEIEWTLIMPTIHGWAKFSEPAKPCAELCSRHKDPEAPVRTAAPSFDKILQLVT